MLLTTCKRYIFVCCLQFPLHLELLSSDENQHNRSPTVFVGYETSRDSEADYSSEQDSF
jgi:hypothetical protein